MTRIHTPWLTTDIARLRELYPKLGAACVDQFPGRTKSQIRSYARHLGLKCQDRRAHQPRGMPREKALATVRKLMQRYGITAEEVA